MIALKKKFLGGMIGSALGDAIGELAFRYRKKEDLDSKLETLEEFRYTDDTAMALGLAESLINKEDIDQADLGKQFHQNYLEEPWRGYGPGPPLLFRMVENSGIGYVEAAKSLFQGQGSFGNGAAMRIVPLGLYFFDSLDIYEKACASSEVTHAHPLGRDGAAIQAKAVAIATDCDPREPFPQEKYVAQLIQTAKTPEMREKLLAVKKSLEDNIPPYKAIGFLGPSVAAHESVPFSLFSFLRHPKSFTECLYCAILNGGDRDTLGAMGCAISGSYLGIDSIPSAWRKKLENRSHIETIALKLADLKRS
jgi:poly(ADP-ribose) glycohydrolase ARH3